MQHLNIEQEIWVYLRASLWLLWRCDESGKMSCSFGFWGVCSFEEGEGFCSSWSVCFLWIYKMEVCTGSCRLVLPGQCNASSCKREKEQWHTTSSEEAQSLQFGCRWILCFHRWENAHGPSTALVISQVITLLHMTNKHGFANVWRKRFQEHYFIAVETNQLCWLEKLLQCMLHFMIPNTLGHPNL